MSTAVTHASVSYPEGNSDAVLLSRYLASRDDAAFAQIVQRYGSMVMGVCRRVLGNASDADDAFQAAFMVLARKAASINPPNMLGHWLYGVAYRTANKARTTRATRRVKERAAMAKPADMLEDAPDPVTVAELKLIVDEEINRLPRAYRQPMIACHLQGLSRAEAAKQLALNEGTLSSRLARAREMLATNLSKRGVALSMSVLALLLVHDAKAAVSPAMASATSKLAVAYAAGKVAGGGKAVALAEGVIRGLTWARLKVAALVAGLLLAVGGMGGVAYYQSHKGGADAASGAGGGTGQVQSGNGAGGGGEVVPATPRPEYSGTPGLGPPDGGRPVTRPSGGRGR